MRGSCITRAHTPALSSHLGSHLSILHILWICLIEFPYTLTLGGGRGEASHWPGPFPLHSLCLLRSLHSWSVPSALELGRMQSLSSTILRLGVLIQTQVLTCRSQGRRECAFLIISRGTAMPLCWSETILWLARIVLVCVWGGERGEEAGTEGVQSPASEEEHIQTVVAQW